MARKKEIIIVPRKNLEQLAKATSSSQTTVYNALAYRSDSEKAKEIRRLAIAAYAGIKTSKIVL